MKRKFTRKRTKKRRSFSRPKNTIIRKMPLISQKCVGLIPIVQSGSSTEKEIVVGFSRYQLAGLLPGGNYGVDSTKRFQQVYKNYEQYIITGMDVKWIPTDVPAAGSIVSSGGAGTLNNLQPIWVWEDIDTLNISGFTDDQILVKDGFKIKQPNRTFHIFRNNRPLAKQQASKWIDTKVPYITTGNDDVPKASLAIKFRWPANYPTADSVVYGYLKYTYYVKFRGQTFND